MEASLLIYILFFCTIFSGVFDGVAIRWNSWSRGDLSSIGFSRKGG
jgi:hypothetical protein